MADDTSNAPVDPAAATPAIEPEDRGATQAAVASPPAESTDTAQAQPDDSAYKDDPVAQDVRETIKTLPKDQQKLAWRIFTQAHQKYADRLKDTGGKAALAEAFTRDPVGTFKAVEKQLRDAGILKDEQSQSQAAQKSEADELAQLLGLDAEQAKALQGILDKRYRQPVEQIQTSVQAKEAQAEAARIEAEFSKKYPDWKKHEAEMTKLGAKFQPAPNTDPLEWMGMLYSLATKDVSAAEATKQLAQKLQDAAKSADTADSGVQSNRVAVTMPNFENWNDGFDRAFQLAKEGKVAARG